LSYPSQAILEFNPLFVFPMVVSASTTKITWELLPEDFVLDDEPVDNVNQPSLAAALTDLCHRKW
jgi:hypothetical protein